MDLLWLFFEICIAAFEVFMMKMLAEGFLKERRNLPAFIGIVVIAACVSISFSVSVLLNGQFVFILLKSVLIATLLSFVFCRAKFYWHIIIGAGYYLICSVAEILAVYIIVALQRIEFAETVDIGSYRYQAIVVANILILLAIQTITRLRRERIRAIPMKIWIILCLLPVFSIMTTLQLIFTNAAREASVTVLSVLSILGLLIINALIFYLFENIIRQSREQERIKTIEAQLAIQKKHSEQLAENRSQVRQMLHDIKHHVQAFQFLYEAGQYEDLYGSVKELARQYERVTPILDTGNPLLDALLTAKREMAEKSGIHWEWDIQIPPDLQISFMELCSILGNALDNAIEACLRSAGDSFILIKLTKENDSLLCSIKNTIGMLPRRSGDFLATLKEDGQHHGIGLESMADGCKKLGGACVITLTTRCSN